MQGYKWIALTVSIALMAACRTERPVTTPAPAPSSEETGAGTDATAVGDDRTAMEAAVEASPSGATAQTTAPASGPLLNPNAPESYVVKRGDTLWGIAKVFLRDPWYWPEIWQVNPQVHNPHLIYPGDTLRLVYIDGKPTLVLQRGDLARVAPRVRSQPLEGAITTIPYQTVAAFMSKPTVLTQEQIKGAPYVVAARDLHVVMADGNTLYARGFSAPAEVGTHYNVVRVGDALRDPDDGSVLGYDGIFTGSGHITRMGDPASLLMTESARESEAGDKLFAGGVEVPLDFMPSAPKAKTDGRIISVTNGVSVIGQYEVVVINRGARDGLAPGNILAVFGAGPVINDTANRGFLNSMTRLASPTVKLPDERGGTFMVFKTFDHLSYGLIMEATDIIRVGDRVLNP